MTKPLDKNQFKREIKREELDEVSREDFTDAIKQVLLAESSSAPQEKREPTAVERNMRFKLVRRRR